MGFERSEQNNLNGCFVNGDRRFLHDVTKDNIRNVRQKTRTNPSLLCCKRKEFVVQYLYEIFAIFYGEKIGRKGEIISPLYF